MMIEVVVNLNVVSAKLRIIGEEIVEGDGLTTVVDLTVDRISGDSLIGNDGLRHVLCLVIVRTAARTECAQQ